MSWLDDHVKRELETFRARFTDDEWEAFRRGGCSRWMTTSASNGERVLCGESRQHARIYCSPCTVQLRHESADYGSLVVPSSVRSMDLSGVE